MPLVSLVGLKQLKISDSVNAFKGLKILLCLTVLMGAVVESVFFICHAG